MLTSLKHDYFFHAGLISIAIFLSFSIGNSAFAVTTGFDRDGNYDDGTFLWKKMNLTPITYAAAKHYCEEEMNINNPDQSVKWQLPTRLKLESFYNGIKQANQRIDVSLLVKMGWSGERVWLWHAPKMGDGYYSYFLLDTGSSVSGNNTALQEYQALCVKSSPSSLCHPISDIGVSWVTFNEGLYCPLHGFSPGAICIVAGKVKTTDVTFFSSMNENSRTLRQHYLSYINNRDGTEWEPEGFLGFSTNGPVYMHRCQY